jgi:hypothetical protein
LRDESKQLQSVFPSIAIKTYNDLTHSRKHALNAVGPSAANIRENVFLDGIPFLKGQQFPGIKNNEQN